MTENEIKKEIEINATPEVVFRALTNINDLTNWFPDKGSFEPKIGGKMEFFFNFEGGHTLRGKVLEIIQDKKLVYTFEPSEEYKPDGKPVASTKVTWSLERSDTNKTKVTLIHSGFTEDMMNHFKNATEGWNYFTVRLVKYCEKIK